MQVQDPEVALEIKKKKKSQAFVRQAFKLLLAINFPQKLGIFAGNHSKACHLGIGWSKSLVFSFLLHCYSCLPITPNGSLRREAAFSIRFLPVRSFSMSKFPLSAWETLMGILETGGAAAHYFSRPPVHSQNQLLQLACTPNSHLTLVRDKRQEAADPDGSLSDDFHLNYKLC